jgi:hypothetical protein
MMNSLRIGAAFALAGMGLLAAGAAADELPGNTFVQVAKDDVGGHYFSQVIYAPTINALVSWGTRTHSAPIRAHETQHFLVDRSEWIDAWPEGKEEAWAGKFKSWGDWNICDPTGFFYERDGVSMPRPNSSFYQCCWDAQNQRVLFYVGSMTFSYDPAKRQWKQIHDMAAKGQPPAMLLWGAMCYDPVNRQALLFGGGGVDARDGRPHTWALDVTTDTWKKLELSTEPPARCNSRMVYDSKNKAIVLYGGDGQDRGLSDTWVFDVARQQWIEKHPAVAPSPRWCHAMAYLEKSGVVLMIGGQAVSHTWQEVAGLSRQAWVYDVAKDAWTPVAAEVPSQQWLCMEALPGTDEVILVSGSAGSHARVTYRFRYDPAAAPGKQTGVPPGTEITKTARTKAWYDDQPPADAAAQAKLLADLPANAWVEMKVPKSGAGRTWGSAIFDSDHGLALKWGGGHSGYQGTDMLIYDVAANRFSIDRTPAFTPSPFGQWARRPSGRTFFNQPWARHQRHTCAYDSVRHVGVFTDAGGSDFYDRPQNRIIKKTWLYDPAKREWLDPISQPFPGGVSPIAVPTPAGVVAYQHDAKDAWGDSGRLYRFVGEAGKPETFGWEEIKIEGAARPYQREFMTMVYDAQRDRLIFLSEDAKKGEPLMWFFSMKDRTWVLNPQQPAGGLSTREAVYVPDQDAILAYGPAGKDDPQWTHVYLCAENRWVTPAIETPHSQAVHEVGMVYDPIHKAAVLLWPPSFEGDIRPHLFRLDVKKLEK